MNRMQGIGALALLFCLIGTPLLAETVEERVRRNASIIYIHGITHELAMQQIGPEGVPYLLELLSDREFERRDNVVAFLVYLSGDEQVPALTSFYENPPVQNDRPEEYRARLMVAEALGHIASRGGIHARVALNAMKADRRIEAGSGMAQMIDHGMKLSTTAPADPSNEASQGAPDFNFDIAVSEPGQGTDPADIDPQPYIEQINITTGSAQNGPTYANHRDTNSPIGDARVDALLDEANYFFAKDDFGGDRACCVTLNRHGSGTTFGSPGDGLDVITTSGELSSVLYNSSSRIKVVDSIQYCGGPGSNILGCAPVPGDGMAVVRMSSVLYEGMLWAHEFGHNTGLGHNAVNGFLMYGGLTGSNVRLTAGECNRFHAPMSGARITPVVLGECHDYDSDNIVSSDDNCPLISNPAQANTDPDPIGDLCDNCPTIDNPDQADCDVDQLGDVCDPSSDPPAEIEPITFTSTTKLTWPALSLEKNVYRGNYTSQPFARNEVLSWQVSPFFQFINDTDTPGQGSLYFYLVTGVNGCGEGL